MKIAAIYLFLLLILTACISNTYNPVFKDFKHSRTITSTTLINESNLLIYPQQILVKDSLLFIVDSGFDHFVLVYNYEKKKPVNRVLSIGRGDGEFTSVLLFNDFNQSSVRLFDAQMQTLFEYSWPGLINGKHTNKETIYCNASYPFRTLKLNDSLVFYTGMDLSGNCQYFMYSLNSKQEECINEFPDFESIRYLSSSEKGMALQAGLIASPNKQHIVAYYSSCGLLDFFKVSGSIVEKVNTKLYFEGDFTSASEENMHSTARSRESEMGFIGAYSTNDYVYVLYPDKTLEDVMNTTKGGRYILCYDWTGEPIMIYELDKPVESFCIRGNTMFGISTNTETYLSEIVLFEL